MVLHFIGMTCSKRPFYRKLTASIDLFLSRITAGCESRLVIVEMFLLRRSVATKQSISSQTIKNVCPIGSIYDLELFIYAEDYSLLEAWVYSQKVL